jgi:hypothetical protein
MAIFQTVEFLLVSLTKFCKLEKVMVEGAFDVTVEVALEVDLMSLGS